MTLRVVQHSSWNTVPAADWDALVAGGSAVLRHAWLHGLEVTGCAASATGWQARPITVHDGDRLVGGAPAWQVDHHRGQFVYQDHWQEAADRSGLPLTPKLVLGVPFTPVTGPRLLRAADGEGDVLRALLQGVQRASRGLQGLHVLFPTQDEAEAWSTRGAFLRRQDQYHWHNADYTSFEDFLARFRSSRRKEIRRERREVADLRIERVVDPDPARIDHLWDAYDHTMRRHGDTDRFLNRAFFEHLAGTMGDALIGVLAWDGPRFVGGALDVFDSSRLYGRWWGQVEARPFLHFELCYHQGIEHCIEAGLQVFEPGHGGEHKFRRGFEPVPTWSAHALPHRGAHATFAKAAQRESDWWQDRLADLQARSPLKASRS